MIPVYICSDFFSFPSTLTSEINECVSEPCKNGAYCLNEVNKFECECVVGYTGVQCDLGKYILIYALF